MKNKLIHILSVLAIIIITTSVNIKEAIASDSIIHIIFINTQFNNKEYLYPYEKQEIKVFYKSNYSFSIYYTTRLGDQQYIPKSYLPADFDINQLYFTFEYNNLYCTLIAEPDSIVLKKDSLIVYNIKGKIKEVTFEKNKICNNELPQQIKVYYPEHYNIFISTSNNNIKFDTVNKLLDFKSILSEGTYYFEYSSEYCLKSYYDSIKIVPAPDITLSEKEIKLCPGNVKKISVESINEDTSIVYYWSNGTTGTYTYVDKPGQYSLIAKNQFECITRDTINVYEKIISAKKIDYITKSVDCYNPGNINILNYEIMDGTYPYKFYLKNIITNDTIDNLTNLIEGKYKIIIKDAENCTTSYEQIVNISKDCLNDYPILAPSLDKINNTHFIPYEGEAIVYDKNGFKKAFFKTPAYWDGSDNNGNPLPTGTYLIVVQNKVIEITIIR